MKRPSPIPARDGGLIRTWTFDEFAGELPLGHFVSGQTFTLSYRMSAEVYSEFGGFDTSTLAGITDLLFLSSDPLPQQDLVSFDFVAVSGMMSAPAGTRAASQSAGLREVVPRAAKRAC